MKHSTSILLLLLILGLFGGHCKKDKEELGCDTNFLEAEINGVKWTAPKVTALRPWFYKILAEEENAGKPAIFFELRHELKPGTVDLAIDPNVSYFGASISPKEGGTYFAESGTMNLAVLDTTARVLRGTFQFRANGNNVIVKNGSFCVKY